jgi:protease I
MGDDGSWLQTPPPFHRGKLRRVFLCKHHTIPPNAAGCLAQAGFPQQTDRDQPFPCLILHNRECNTHAKRGANVRQTAVFRWERRKLEVAAAMKDHNLTKKTIAILATDGFEQVELVKPKEALEAAGATTRLVSLKSGAIQGFNHFEKGDSFPVDETVDSADAAAYDGLVLPGGLHNPDALRMNEKAVAFVRSFFEQHKPVAAICHGPWTLVEANVVEGRTLTSWPSVKTDIINAGGNWVDEEVHCDQGLVTSRKPDDLPAFCAKMIEEFAEGKHALQTA